MDLVAVVVIISSCYERLLHLYFWLGFFHLFIGVISWKAFFLGYWLGIVYLTTILMNGSCVEALRLSLSRIGVDQGRSLLSD